MSIPVELFALPAPLLLAIGLLLSSRLLIATAIGAAPLAICSVFVDASVLFGSPDVLAFLALACLCSAGLTWQIQERLRGGQGRIQTQSRAQPRARQR